MPGERKLPKLAYHPHQIICTNCTEVLTISLRFLHFLSLMRTVKNFYTTKSDHYFAKKNWDRQKQKRIHAINRVKRFKLIRNEIPLTFHGSVNQIWTVVCILCNIFLSSRLKKLKHVDFYFFLFFDVLKPNNNF